MNGKEASNGKQPVTLSGKQVRHLRALGHHLEPVVQLGKLGYTDQAQRAIDEALTQHELVKIRIGTECPQDRKELATTVPDSLKASLAQSLGRTLLLYRKHPKKPVIKLPPNDAPARV